MSSSPHRHGGSPESMADLNASDGSRVCFCGKIVHLRVATTPKNASRRFWGCASWPNRECSFFAWRDKELTPRGVQYALQMQQENRALRQQIRELERQLLMTSGGANSVEASSSFLSVLPEEGGASSLPGSSLGSAPVASSAPTPRHTEDFTVTAGTTSAQKEAGGARLKDNERLAFIVVVVVLMVMNLLK